MKFRIAADRYCGGVPPITLLSLKKIINNVFLTAVHAICGISDVIKQDREAR